MAQQTPEPAGTATKRVVLITHEIDAPREQVFQGWIDPNQFARWWGPKNFTNPVCEVDARPDGALNIVMRSPDGVDYQ
jgi:uncharacterized protein YndB with AHSA1/START domain